MKANNKDRVKLLLICSILFILGFMVFYLIFNEKPSGMYMSFYFVEESNTERIEVLKKNNNNYGYKVEADSKLYLKVFEYNSLKKNYVEFNVSCTEEQLKEIPDSSYYWLDIKYIRGNKNNMRLKKITTENIYE